MEYKARPTFDHKGAVVQVHSASGLSRVRCRVCFLKLWLMVDEANIIVRTEWQQVYQGCPLLHLLNKLNAVGRKLKKWNYHRFGRIEGRIETIL